MLAPLKRSAIALICFENADLQLVEAFIWISLCGPFGVVRFFWSAIANWIDFSNAERWPTSVSMLMTIADQRDQRWSPKTRAQYYLVESTRTVAIGSSALPGSETSIPVPDFAILRGVWLWSASKYAPMTSRGTLSRWKLP